MLQVASAEGNAPGPGALDRVERGHRGGIRVVEVLN